jgi:Ser-tRNA(Ala) deacylase AlaX
MIINEPNKNYNEPMHTCEHILNQTMVRMFGCGRAISAHIERKKSKCDYLLQSIPTELEVVKIEEQVNCIINQHLPVTSEIVDIEEATRIVDVSRLPKSETDQCRIVKIGSYDVCACIGQHVSNTAQIGRFKIISHEYKEGLWRVRFRLL